MNRLIEAWSKEPQGTSLPMARHHGFKASLGLIVVFIVLITALLVRWNGDLADTFSMAFFQFWWAFGSAASLVLFGITEGAQTFEKKPGYQSAHIKDCVSDFWAYAWQAQTFGIISCDWWLFAILCAGWTVGYWLIVVQWRWAQ